MRSGFERRVKRVDQRGEQLEMLDKHGGEVGFEGCFSRQGGTQSPLLALDQIHGRMIGQKALGRTRERVALEFNKDSADGKCRTLDLQFSRQPEQLPTSLMSNPRPVCVSDRLRLLSHSLPGCFQQPFCIAANVAIAEDRVAGDQYFRPGPHHVGHRIRGDSAIHLNAEAVATRFTQHSQLANLLQRVRNQCLPPKPGSTDITST